MIAQNKGMGIQLIIAVIDKHTQLPYSIRMKDNHGEWTRIRVGSLRTHNTGAMLPSDLTVRITLALKW